MSGSCTAQRPVARTATVEGCADRVQTRRSQTSQFLPAVGGAQFPLSAYDGWTLPSSTRLPSDEPTHSAALRARVLASSSRTSGNRLVNPEFPATAKIEASVQAAAPSLGLNVTSLVAKDRASLEKALDSLAMSPPDALIATEALAVQLSAELIKHATALRVPVIHFWPGTAEQGALLSYQADVHDNFRRAAGYVDKILKGAKPSDLPIYQSARYELVVNPNVARTLGLTLAPSFVSRADRVIP